MRTLRRPGGRRRDGWAWGQKTNVREVRMISAREALERLREGNRRFVADRERGARVDAMRRNELTERQEPIAIIASDGLLVVGAEYSLETGIVEFFEGVPPARRRAQEPPYGAR